MSSAAIGETFRPSEDQAKFASLAIAPGVLILVNAYAGTGKTTTLELFTRRNPKKRFLYLVFANKNAKEAKDRFPSNVHPTTVHGLAKERHGIRYFDAGKMGENRVRASDLMKKYELTYDDASNVIDTVSAFLNSTDQEITYANIAKRDKLSGAAQDRIVTFARRHLSAMRDLNDTTPATHDLYLKEWVGTKPVLSEYDCILVDEAQDSNRVTLELVMSQWIARRCAVVFVGDRHQNVFAFRDTVNAMEVYDRQATDRIRLSESYRFPAKVGKWATDVLMHFKGETVPVKGKAPAPTPGWLEEAFVKNREWRAIPGRKFAEIPPKDAQGPTMCILARTNGTLLKFAIAMLASDPEKKFHFAGTSKRDNWSPRSAYFFTEIEEACALALAKPGKPPEMKTKLMRQFTSWLHFKTHADEQNDHEASRIISLVEAIKPAELPAKLKAIEKACVSDMAYTTLATAHRSKGLEWDRVKVLGDFKNILLPETRERIGPAEVDAEANLLYVAITRAKKECIVTKPEFAVWLDMPLDKQRDVVSGKLKIKIEKPTELAKTDK
jgi:F-box protein, helicase, 18